MLRLLHLHVDLDLLVELLLALVYRDYRVIKYAALVIGLALGIYFEQLLVVLLFVKSAVRCIL